MDGVSVLFFTRREDADFSFCRLPYRSIVYASKKKEPANTVFSVKDGAEYTEFSMLLSGEYNIQNAVTAVLIARLHGISDDDISNTLSRFTGVGRRFDLVGTVDGVPVYDDYAHHPTEIRAVLTMCREYFPGKKIFAVFEPHQISRLTLMFDGYVNALTIADQVVIWRTHIGREALKGLSPIPKERWMGASERIAYEEDENRIIEMARDFVKNDPESLIIVFGAANSYKISRAMAEESACEKESVGTV